MTSLFYRRDRKKWVVQHRENGRASTAYFAKKKDAKAEKDWLDRRALASAGKAPDLTVADFARRWIEQLAPLLRPGTQHVYLWAIRRHIDPNLGHLALRAVTPSNVKDMISDLLGRGLAKKSVRNVRGTLVALLGEAKREGWIETNPALDLGRRYRLTPTRAERRERIKALTAEQLEAFLAAAEPKWALAFFLGSRTGVRPGELLALQWDDVDLPGRRIEVRRSVTAWGVSTTKTGEARTVDLSGAVVGRLAAWDVESKRIALQRGEERSPWLFPSSAGTPIDHKYLAAAFRRALKAAGLPATFTPHSLRHTFASLALSSGLPIQYVQQQLGHATIQMTVDHYGSWLPIAAPSWMDDLEGVLGDSEKTALR